MIDNKIKILSDIEHCLLRPAMYLGSVAYKERSDYFLEDDKIVYGTRSYVPALVKMIDEILDNAVDEFIRTDGEHADQIKIKVTPDTITIRDNGRGIPVVEEESTGEYGPVLAWGRMKAGSNFEDDDGRMTAGMNGVGAALCNIFSTEFRGETSDGAKKLVYTTKNNMDTNDVKVSNSPMRYTQVSFSPDFSRLECDGIDDVVQDVIKQRVLITSMIYPGIKFTLNGKAVKPLTPKKFISLFGEGGDIISGPDDKWFVGVAPNSNDDFRFFSYVNALHMKEGGNHIDNISYNIVNRMRDKLIRKHKGIKPGDIKNKLQLVVFFRDFPKFETNSQTKESLSNSVSFIRDYMGDVDWDKFTARLTRNKAITDPITEVFKIKEEFKKRQELKSLGKSTKKIKSEKYFPAIGTPERLFLCEGTSARVGLMKILGRKGNSYYELKGVPLNAFSATQQKFTANKELSELFKIINNTDHEQIVISTDADLDGIHIRGLLLGFFNRYMPEYLDGGKIGVLDTPVMILKKGSKVHKWAYTIDEANSWTAADLRGRESFYVKGLGSWSADQLKQVIKSDGLNEMIKIIDHDNDGDEVMDDWLSDDKCDKRKEYVLANEFSIAKV